MKLIILYYSHKGRTAQYAREIAMYLWQKGCDISLSAISDLDIDKIKNSDAVISGCWTCGWFIFNQHPHKQWIKKSTEIKDILPKNVLLFTTYKIRVGLLFSRMKRVLGIKDKIYTLSSKTGFLSSNDKLILDKFVETIKSNK